MDIAFDPSINNLGYCIFRNGKVIECDTLHPPKIMRGDDERVRWLYDRVMTLLPEHPKRVAVETFGPHRRPNAMPMHKLGMVIGMLNIWAHLHGAQHVRVDKGYTPKEESVLLAKHDKILTPKGKTPDTDACVAYHLGLIAGFGKKGDAE